jgi:hypothetical protein
LCRSLFGQKVLEGFDGPGVQSTRPALALPDDLACLQKRPALVVVRDQQLLLLLGEFVDRLAHQRPEFLLLQSLFGAKGLILDLEVFYALQAGREDGCQTLDGSRDLPTIIIGRGSTFVASHLLIVLALEVGRGPFAYVDLGKVATFQRAHLAEAVVDGALDAVVGEGQKVGTELGVEAVGGLDEPDVSVGDEVFDVEAGAELFTHLCRE